MKGTFFQMSLNLQAMDSEQLALAEQKNNTADTKNILFHPFSFSYH